MNDFWTNFTVVSVFLVLSNQQLNKPRILFSPMFTAFTSLPVRPHSDFLREDELHLQLRKQLTFRSFNYMDGCVAAETHNPHQAHIFHCTF